MAWNAGCLPSLVRNDAVDFNERVIDITTLEKMKRRFYDIVYSWDGDIQLGGNMGKIEFFSIQSLTKTVSSRWYNLDVPSRSISHNIPCSQVILLFTGAMAAGLCYALSITPER
jgi:hypothetical protein